MDQKEYEVTGRTLPHSLAALVEAFELDQPLVVTVAMIGQIANVDQSEARQFGYRLQKLGWLGSLGTREAWEFMPGARAGRYGSGDRFIEMRAKLAVNSAWPGVLAMDSAASVLGMAQRMPLHEVVALPKGSALPQGMSGWRAVHVDIPGVGRSQANGLPMWNLDGLVVAIAIKPSGYEDTPSLAQWLPEVGDQLNQEVLVVCLGEASQTAWQRAAYLASLANNQELSDSLVRLRPATNTVWFGPPRKGGVFHSSTNIADADLAPYLSGGTGA